jgi:hypothetical protein
MFEVFLVSYLVLATGQVREYERVPMAPYASSAKHDEVASLKVKASEHDMCRALKHQREFTHYTPEGALGIVYICQEVW